MFNKLKEKQLIKCTKDEINRFQQFEFKINEQVDNLLILISTGGLVFSSNLIQHLDYSLSMFKWSWVILVFAILFSLTNRIITSEKTSLYLGKFYKADLENKNNIEVPKILSVIELFFYFGSCFLVFLGIILLSLSFVIKL
ncbi:MAG: hypothetical protein NTZ87_02325 [Candidatus Nomurabacteria bacterium]|nr:hypothetical protein [Candidatus Nomurabacteria bacterium]